MSALVILPSGCLDDDTYDQQVDATESHTPEAGKDDAPELIDVSTVTDEPQPAEEPAVQTTIASTSGRSGSGSSSSSSSSPSSPDVNRVVISGDYTEPTGTIIGNLTITGATTGTITLPIGLTVNGNLIVNTPDATVYNYATVGGNINIIAVSVNTWNQYGNAGSIQMGATNATFYFFSGNITQGISLINPCNVIIDVNATGLPLITVTEDAEGSDIDNLGTEELNLIAQANVTVAGNVNTTATGGATVTERVSTPIANPAAGIYVGTQNIVLTTATDGATIYYTTDGNLPTGSSTEYLAAIEIVSNMTIKAIAVDGVLDNSGVAEFVYVITSVDKSALTTAISAANTKHDAAVEGIEIGEYATGSKATFNTAIDAAELVAADVDATQAAVNTAVTDLATAEAAFDAAVIS